MTEINEIEGWNGTGGDWEAVFSDDPRGAPSPMYRELIGLSCSGGAAGYVAVIAPDQDISLTAETLDANCRMLAGSKRLALFVQKVGRTVDAVDWHDPTAVELGYLKGFGDEARELLKSITGVS